MRTRSAQHFSIEEYEQQFAAWHRTEWQTEKSKRKRISTKRLSDQVKGELLELRQLTSSDYELKRKWYELQDFKSKYTAERLDEVYNRIWKPNGFSDFRRITPELIYVKSAVTSQKVDIWGNVGVREWAVEDPLSEDWDILRTLLSRHRNSGVIGTQHRYLVRDKGTKSYLGVICISGDMLQPAGRDKIIGWTAEQKKRMQPHCANGSTIVAAAPFSFAFNGGKLLALLCLSDIVAERWFSQLGTDKTHYRLVHVMTTSLFGNAQRKTMYDSLEPYWNRTPNETSGATQFELSPQLERRCLEWLFLNDPKAHFNHFVAKKKNGTPRYRDPKDKALKVVFRELGIPEKDFSSGHKRGMYLAPLYENAYEFLREEIVEGELIQKFDNSVAALTRLWKFELKKDNSGAKTRLDYLLTKQRKAKLRNELVEQLPTTRPVFWYREMMEMTWEEARAAFGSAH